MGMIPDDQVRARLRDQRGLFPLRPVRFRGALRSPVNVNHHEIADRLRLFYFRKEQIHIPGAENAGRGLRRSSRARIVHPLDLRRRKERDLHIFADKIYRPDGLAQIPARSHIGHADGLQSVQGIQKGNFPIVIGVVVCQRHDIRPHLGKQGRMGRIRAEGKAFSFDGRSPVCIGKFIIHHEYVRAAHPLQNRRIEARVHQAAASRPAFHPGHDAVAVVKQDISRKGQGDLPFLPRDQRYGVFRGHPRRIGKQCGILSLCFRGILQKRAAFCSILHGSRSRILHGSRPHVLRSGRPRILYDSRARDLNARKLHVPFQHRPSRQQKRGSCRQGKKQYDPEQLQSLFSPSSAHPSSPVLSASDPISALIIPHALLSVKHKKPACRPQ